MYSITFRLICPIPVLPQHSAYDVAAVKFRGGEAQTNFPLQAYSAEMASRDKVRLVCRHGCWFAHCWPSNGLYCACQRKCRSLGSKQ